LLAGGPQAAPSPRVSPSEVKAFAAAVAAEQRLPQYNVTWERAYSDLAPFEVDDEDTAVESSRAFRDLDKAAGSDADLGSAPAAISPQEEQDAQERDVLKPKRSPHLPTEEERRAHEVSHVPYRSWCPACVAGRGKSDRHTVSTEEHTQPTVSIDYCYLCSEKKDEAKATPILAMRVSEDSWLDGLALPSKGTGHPYNAKALASDSQGKGIA